MHELPQGRKSRIEILQDAGTIRKTYNANGDPAEKYRREVGFYLHYNESLLLPKLVCSDPGKHITIERVIGERLADSLPLSHESMGSLADDYIQKLVELFGSSTIIDSAIKQEYYDGIGVEENIGRLTDSLARLCEQYCRHTIILDLLNSVVRIRTDEELLIKLDWNPENVFLRDCEIHKFIDFEQAFIGTRDILAGILLHNPVWPAQQLFGGLKNAGLFQAGSGELRNYLCYSFAAVLVDSIQRRGDIWEIERLEAAFAKHVIARHNEALNAS